MGSYRPKEEKDSLENVFTSARQELQDLQEEMEAWFDGMPENLQGSEKGDAVNQASDELSGADQQLPDDLSDLPESVREMEITYTISENKNKRRGSSREIRCSNACIMMEAVADALDDHAEGEDFNEEVQSLIEDAAASVRTCKDEAECIEFPGMFG